MERKNQEEWTYFDIYHGSKHFEFCMEYEDAQKCCHPGHCDDDCEAVKNYPYIRKQFDDLSDEQLKDAAWEYGVDFEEYRGKKIPREILELYIVWLAAGDIVENVYERENCA